MVRSSGRTANAMVDFTNRLVTDGGVVSACTCISSEGQRREADLMLENLVENFTQPVETRISRATAEDYLQENASHYDITFVGASTNRSVASRFVSPPTFERIQDIECDIAIVDTS